MSAADHLELAAVPPQGGAEGGGRMKLRAAKKDPRTSVTTYLRKFAAAVMGPGVDVPCGDCHACCKAGYIVEPIQGESLELFTARTALGRPMLPVRDDGSCVYLGPNGCDVHDRRPRGCRGYDCRLFAIAGVLFDLGSSPVRAELNRAILAWDARRFVRTNEDAFAIAALRLAVREARRRGLADIESMSAFAAMHYVAWIPEARRLHRSLRDSRELVAHYQKKDAAPRGGAEKALTATTGGSSHAKG